MGSFRIMLASSSDIKLQFSMLRFAEKEERESQEKNPWIKGKTLKKYIHMKWPFQESNLRPQMWEPSAQSNATKSYGLLSLSK